MNEAIDKVADLGRDIGDPGLDPRPLIQLQHALARAYADPTGKHFADVGEIVNAVHARLSAMPAGKAFLEKNGVTRLDIVAYISHGISKVPAAGGPRRQPRTDGRARRRTFRPRRDRPCRRESGRSRR